ncbi:DUF4430 domain-containing protein [bacterium]|jgi:hypothetical protein|nr:DUF4430 domain-containing protein [bacterium]MBT4335172.1 DUF4430 domain-containing protein [bacterium]MBT4495437.1 DUF4430 domain-containing protein [bacterium]MBT4763771.1 DUF4430 domain-containing protein [bacterium]MBT5401141.1 DUF4430 domain-containing protein [bacterium]
MKLFKLLLIALIFFIAGFFVGQGYNLPVNNESNENIEIGQLSNLTIAISFSDINVMEIQNLVIDSNKSVLDLLSLVVEENNIEFSLRDYGDLGYLVERIGDMKNGDDNKFWQFWINGEYSQIGAADYLVQSNDLIEWKFTDNQY